MLRSTFCCFDGISESAELRLWQKGCLTWNFVLHEPNLPFSKKKNAYLRNQIVEAKVASEAGLISYFQNRLPAAHKLRMLNDLESGIGYLDIETTGLSKNDYITTLTVYLDKQIHTFIAGINLAEFLRYVPKIKMLVTFNGNRFDIPFIERQFNFNLNLPHIDLMLVLKSWGLHGGLKECEKQLGFSREGFDDIDGKAAIQLWHEYVDEKSRDALRRLIRYNAEDAVVLESMAVWAYNQSMSAFPIQKKLMIPERMDVSNLTIPKQS